MLYYCTKGSTGSHGDIHNDPAVEAAIRFIKAHLTEELSLQIVAQGVSLSPIYFHNLFKKTVGMTLHSYIEQQRIKKAIDLLLTTDHSLTRIAYECGFSSQSYFSYAFKRKIGIPHGSLSRISTVNMKYEKILL